MLGVLVEVLNPLKVQLVVGLSIVADSYFPSWWNFSLIPGVLVKLAIEDDERRDCLSFRVDRLNRGDPFPVARLFRSWPALSI